MLILKSLESGCLPILKALVACQREVDSHLFNASLLSYVHVDYVPADEHQVFFNDISYEVLIRGVFIP